MNIYNKWLMRSKSHSLYFEFEDMIKTIEEYGLITVFENGANSMFLTYEEQEYFIFKAINGDKVSYNIFYDNIHIRMECSSKEKVYSVHLKKVEDNWSFNKSCDNDDYDYSHPTNSTFRVFVSYDVPVLNITRAVGDNYTHGAWDGYVYKSLNELKSIIDSCTDAAQFNKNYK